MLFRIYNVGHGFCALAIARNRNVLLFDCGHRSEPEYRPSRFLRRVGVQAIEYLFITNFDEDHISDLPNVRRAFSIDFLSRNWSLDAEQLRQIKRKAGPITPAMESLLQMMRSYTTSTSNPPETPGIRWRTFYNSFPTFEDTNNLSTAVFLQVGDLTIMMPGDLERPGWRRLLESEDFCEWLRSVDVFVASHHGRESGYCEEVFDYTAPLVVIFSDSERVHASQEMTEVYARHASGVQFDGETRYVLTTRNDGDILWEPS